MDKYKRYIGVVVFVIAVVMFIFAAVHIVTPQYEKWDSLTKKLEKVTQTLAQKQQERAIIVKKLKKLQASVMSSQKKIYSPVENYGSDKNDTLFFTLYSDVIDMVRANTIKIKSIDYQYNPSGDIFVKQKGSMYFVCDVNMEIVSNYVNLGKLIQDIYQYPYYIKIIKIEVIPYAPDKKILLSNITLRLYAHTTPSEELARDVAEGESMGNGITDTETTPLPQQ